MLNLSHIIASGPYHQNSTKVRKGCQIDYLIQTTTQTLYLCEFKFSKRTLGLEVLEQMENKKKSLEISRGRGICLVLIHTSGVTKALDTSGSFYRIIDIRDFFKSPNEQQKTPTKTSDLKQNLNTSHHPDFKFFSMTVILSF